MDPLTAGPIPFGLAGPLRLECGVDLTSWVLVDAAGRPVRSGGRVVAGAPWTLEAEGLVSGWHALVCTASDGRRWTLEVLVD